MLHVTTIVGARPQFIKAAALSAEIRDSFSAEISETIVHTGQHFDRNMSRVFFQELEIPEPSVTLTSEGGGHGEMTGQMLAKLDVVLTGSRPDLVLVYGDTNSTLAGALCAVKLGIPVAHVEAGMRSNNWNMPEEINRVITDRISALNFAPSEGALAQLERDGLAGTGVLAGDIMFDAVRRFSSSPLPDNSPLKEIGSPFGLATVHRQENTDRPETLERILGQLIALSKSIPIVFPMHPRVRIAAAKLGLLEAVKAHLKVVEPVSFLEMMSLTQRADFVITDSGGLQKEAFYLKTPCFTVRTETEWGETIDLGWNRLVDPFRDDLTSMICSSANLQGASGSPYGDGFSARKILETLISRSWASFFN